MDAASRMASAYVTRGILVQTARPPRAQLATQQTTRFLLAVVMESAMLKEHASAQRAMPASHASRRCARADANRMATARRQGVACAAVAGVARGVTSQVALGVSGSPLVSGRLAMGAANALRRESVCVRIRFVVLRAMNLCSL